MRARSPCLEELREDAAFPSAVTGPRDLAPFSRAMSARVRSGVCSLFCSIWFCSMCFDLDFSGAGRASRIGFAVAGFWG